ncbi:OmpA family protein [Rhodocytophaga rosea]|uniref:OmpA family protein n=1 Tax=Rhodocytophaga rosea TaxID=2704465 RepID=A0A6C0GCY2_9BACT|nr:OmpA family protein [Rhodocytophaga rosea]QHT65738.1 OmpA family protein [Rhodocytophaga rosea]
MKKAIYCIFFLCLLVNGHLFAQSVKRIFKEADGYFESAEYETALDLYLQGLKLDPENAQANFKAGMCYLQSIHEDRAIPYLLKAYKKMPDVSPDIQFYLAEAYQYNHQFAEAKQAYEQYKSTYTGKDAAVATRLSRRIFECENGIKYIKQPVKAQIDNIGPIVNTKFAEYAPVISADESVLVFTSRREGSTGNFVSLDDNQYYEDIYIANKVNGTWTAPKNIQEINTEKHDACIALSADGKQLFIYKDSKGGDIYVSNFDAGENIWSKPQSLGDNVNTKYQEPSVSMTADGNTIYFSSNRPGGTGGLDIYMSRKDEKGKWGEAVNISGPVNTPYDEDAPFIHPDGQTLYFSSRGHAGMGNYDIYRSTLDAGGKWSEPENLGYPINTSGDDTYFVLSADNQHGYYASAKEGGVGEKDIYIISMPKREALATTTKTTIQPAKPALKTLQVGPTAKADIKSAITILKGTVIDAFSKAPLEADIVLVNNENAETVSEQRSDTSGFYKTTMPSGKNYGFSVQKEGYLFHSENYDIPASEGYQEITLNVELKKVSVGSRIILRNIFFDFDKATLKKESTAELEKLLEIMNEVPTLKIEISGHTDNKGSADYNKKLSERRAKSVVDYLLAKGISPDRLRYAGYGMDRPLVSNDEEEGRQLNRRTEFEIIGN